MVNVQTLLDRYQSIIPDIELFKKVSCQALPLTFWVNNMKTNHVEVQSLLAKDGVEVERCAWSNNAFRCLQDIKLGNSWQYLAGLIQIQEEVSMLAGYLLAPKPYETVLDFCAAPGNKTAQMAISMNNTGTLIANDRNFGRMRAMGQIMKRLGLINISTTIYDGIHLPLENHYFDRILVDAPCSCEGTFRKNLNKETFANVKNSQRLAHTQLGLLRKAIKACKPGGTILYSTCTFAPEENESVVSRALKHYADMEVVSINIPGFNFSPGLTTWQGEDFHSDMIKTARIWPHQNNTGGFYLALLRKKGTLVASQKINKKIPNEVVPYLKELEDRFGIESKVWEQYSFSEVGKKGIYIRSLGGDVPEIKVDATGLFFIKTNANISKLSTAGAMQIGKYAKRNIIDITKIQLKAFYNREEIQLDGAQLALCTTTGFCLVRYQNHVVGMGLYLSALEEKPARLQSLSPKYFKS